MLNTRDDCAISADMTRTRTEDRTNVVGRDSKVIGVRITPAEQAALEALVALRQQVVADQGLDDVTITPTGIMRSLLRKEAKARGVWRVDLEPSKQPASEDEIPDAEPVIEPADVRDMVLAVVRAQHALSRTGFVMVFDVVRAVLSQTTADFPTVLSALTSLDPSKIELRGDSSVGLLSTAEAALCPVGPTGRPISVIRVRSAHEKQPDAIEAVDKAVDKAALRERLAAASNAGITIRALAAETNIPSGTLGPFKTGKPMSDTRCMQVAAALKRHGY